MNGDLKMREQLSALADGELASAHCAQAVAFADCDEGRAAWHEYHLIGDVLRSSELARPLSCDLIARLRADIAAESGGSTLVTGDVVQVAPAQEQAIPERAAASHGVPAAILHDIEAANHDVFRWKMVAGFASLAAVATIGWNAYTGLTAPASQQGVQLAAVPAAASQPMQAPQTLVANVGAGASSGQQAVMIRDPRLDELLAAHKQYGNTSALQMPAGFLRNATFEAPAR